MIPPIGRGAEPLHLAPEWPHVRTLLRRQADHLPSALPQLDIISINEQFCRFDRRLVVRADQINGRHEMTMLADRIDAVMGHVAVLQNR
jgi:hypothetical protein